MKKRIADWLYQFADWLSPPPPPPPPPQPSPLDLRARIHVEDTERTSSGGTSGEFKRHVVYAKLIDEFPGARKRDIALAIEHAVQAVLP